MKKMKPSEKILVVDDEHIVALSIKGLLDNEGYTVTIETSGKEALQRLHRESFDLVLTDLVMGRVDGLEIIKKIKQKSPETIVMIMTAYASLDSAIEAMRIGAYDYLIKPCPNQHLKMSVKRALEKKRLGIELKRKTTELEKTNKELAERMEDIAVIHQIADKIQKFSALDTLLSQIAQGVRDNLGFERVLISLAEKHEGALKRCAAAGVSQEEFQKLRVQKPPIHEIAGLFKKKYRMSRSYYIRHSEQEETIAKYGSTVEDIDIKVEPNRWHPGDALITPLLSEKGDLIGIISVDNPKNKKIPSLMTIRTLETLASTASAAIDRTKLEEKLAAIYDLSRETTLTLNKDEIYTSVLDVSTKVLHFDNMAIILIDKQTDETYIAAHIGYPKEIESRRLPVDGDKGITVQAIQSGKSVLVSDVRNNIHFLEGRPGTLSELAVPMKVKDETIGVLNVESNTLNAFDEKDVALLSALASHTATALELTHLIAEVNRTKKYLANLVDSSPDAIMSTDKEGMFTLFSKGAEKLFGYSAQEIIGKSTSDYYQGGTEETKKIMRVLREKKQITDYETTFLAKNGTAVPISLSASLLLNENDDVEGTLGIGKDITERKRIEKEQKNIQDQLAQSEKLSALGEFISGIAHEINNPLTGILGFSQLLLDSDCNSTTKKDVEKIHTEAMRCVEIVNNLLSFAREQKPERCYVNVNSVVESALNLKTYQLKVDGVEIVKKLSELLPKTMADPHQLEQVFLNIITNAHQAMIYVKEKRCLTIQTETDEDIIRIKITDTGPGIPPEHLKRIFEPFYTTKEVGQGTGLGLSLSYGFIQEHAGSIYATSKLGEGATFVIELPITEMSPPQEEVTTPLRIKSLRGDKILVVDDEQVVLDLLSDVLHRLGHHVDTAVNGKNAQALIRKNDYDLILTDVKMPGMDGQQLYNYVLSVNPELAKRMIFMTGYALSPEMQTFLKVSGNRYIEKPFDIDTLQSFIHPNP